MNPGVTRRIAAAIKPAVKVPVIAVGRLGDPLVAERILEEGKADFIALGRSLIAEPDWVEKLRLGEPPRRCLACNTCVDEMRGGAKLGCVVNGTAGKEALYAAAQPPQGERIAVVGAGPAGLTYASLVAKGNTVTTCLAKPSFLALHSAPIEVLKGMSLLFQ